MPTWPFLTGSVNEFLDGAMIVVIIMIIYYILKLLYMLLKSDGEFEIPRCIKRICDDFGKERDNYKRILDELEELINQLEELFRQLKTIGQQILDFLEDNKDRPYDSDRPEIPVDLLTKYNELLSQISNLKDQIVLKITEISDLLSKLNRAERQRFSNLTGRFSVLVANINTFVTKVKDAMRDCS
jgi:regulator of replication initiation timing